MKRKRLDQTTMRPGDRLRVYFPYGAQPRLMRVPSPVAVGETEQESFRLVDDATGQPEWVPGWYVVTQVSR